MSGKCLLDTNIVIALFANETAVKDNLARTDEVFVSSVVIGELCYGAHKSTRAKENLSRIDDFASSSLVLGCDTETARVYGEIKNSLRLKGRPLPENDIWIAAIAVQHNLTLVSRDAHFSEIENLEVVAW
ncbi:MAG TPA: type II toxin-antitoxin system VapC family toxin [Anaerolineales bacterium]|nr:type II toxin-antitoxin system VapC family toxin [Anaerolineales bacterium]